MISINVYFTQLETTITMDKKTLARDEYEKMEKDAMKAITTAQRNVKKMEKKAASEAKKVEKEWLNKLSKLSKADKDN